MVSRGADLSACFDLWISETDRNTSAYQEPRRFDSSAVMTYICSLSLPVVCDHQNYFVGCGIMADKVIHDANK